MKNNADIRDQGPKLPAKTKFGEEAGLRHARFTTFTRQILNNDSDNRPISKIKSIFVSRDQHPKLPIEFKEGSVSRHITAIGVQTCEKLKTSYSKNLAWSITYSCPICRFKNSQGTTSPLFRSTKQ